MRKIIKTMTFQELFASFPEKRELLAMELFQLGLGCIGCAQGSWETIEQGLQAHGIEEIDTIIEKLNRIVENTPQS